MMWNRLQSVVRLSVPDSLIIAMAETPFEVADVMVGLRPRVLWWMPIVRAQHVHRWMYWRGETLADKQMADRTLLDNICRLIEGCGGPRWLVANRRDDAYELYEMYVKFGGADYWETKRRIVDVVPLDAGIKLSEDAATTLMAMDAILDRELPANHG